MRRQELLGPVLVVALTLFAVASWSYVFVSQDQRVTSSDPSPVAATASSAPIGSMPSAVDDPDVLSVVVVGDSWTDPQSQPGGSFLTVAAEQLGWTPTVVEDGTGTGWLSRGPDEAGTYAERLRDQEADLSVDLIVLQGGSLDESILIANPTISLRQAADKTLALAKRRYADAGLVVVGPVAAPGSGPVLDRIDRTLARASDAAGATYVSPLAQGWLGGADAPSYLDKATGLPTSQGRAVLADRFVAAVRDLPVS